MTLANGRVPLVAGVQKSVYIISDDFDFIDWFAGIWFDNNMAVICEALGLRVDRPRALSGADP